MDDYLDPYLFTSSCSDAKIKERSCWDQLRVYQDDENSSPLSTIGSNHSYECLAAHNNNTPLPLHGVRHGLQMDSENCSANSGLQFNSAVHSKDVPVTGDLNPAPSFNEMGHLICNGGESSEFQRSFSGFEMETLSPITQLWHLHPYDSVPSLPTLMEQTSYMQSSYLQEENVNVDDGGNISRFVEIDKILQPETLSASINAKGKQDMQNSLYSSFHRNHQISNTIGLSSKMQSASPNPNNGCNGTAKPRVRARRGQATDPHSIAERLRREKIAERLKNLQELVPNSNKTDKASTLDEIIEYVKFLQLQVKVLSMSRLGAAAAVVPLITDGQVEGFNGSSLTPLAVQGVDFSPSPDQVVFEQEVVKLMDSNVTMAMQYLQSKGLCLMPIALAAAVSNGKALSSSSSLSALVSKEKKKSGPSNCHIKNDIVRNTCSGNGVVQNSNCSSSSSNSSGSLAGVGIHHIDSDGNFMILKLSSDTSANTYNGTLKQEDVNTLCTAND